MHEFSLNKNERLSRKKLIDKLFEDGKTLFVYPLKLVYAEMELPVEYPIQTGFSVSKRNFKRAVKRNKIKRLLRETYRLNKGIVYDAKKEKQLAVMIIYSGKVIEDYQFIEKSMKKALKKLIGLTKTKQA